MKGLFKHWENNQLTWKSSLLLRWAWCYLSLGEWMVLMCLVRYITADTVYLKSNTSKWF